MGKAATIRARQGFYGPRVRTKPTIGFDDRPKKDRTKAVRRVNPGVMFRTSTPWWQGLGRNR